MTCWSASGCKSRQHTPPSQYTVRSNQLHQRPPTDLIPEAGNMIVNHHSIKDISPCVGGRVGAQEGGGEGGQQHCWRLTMPGSYLAPRRGFAWHAMRNRVGAHAHRHGMSCCNRHGQSYKYTRNRADGVAHHHFLTPPERKSAPGQGVSVSGCTFWK